MLCVSLYLASSTQAVVPSGRGADTPRARLVEDQVQHRCSSEPIVVSQAALFLKSICHAWYDVKGMREGVYLCYDRER